MSPSLSLEADDGGVPHAGVGDQHLLDVVRVDLGAVGHDEHVLLAALERQEALGVEHAVVAGVVPAVLHDGRGRVRALPVALEDVRAAHEHLAVGRDADLDARDHLANGADAVGLDSGERDDRRGLRRAVALERDHAHVLPAPCDVRVHGRSADREVAQRAAEAGEDRAEQEAPQRHGQACADRVQPLVGRAPAVGVDAPLDRVRQQLHDLRHRQQHRHLPLAERPRQDGRLEAGGIDDLGTGQHRCQEPGVQSVHVRQRKDGEQARLRPQRHDAAQARRVGGDVAVAEHDALRVARRPGGEDDLGERVGRDLRAGERLSLPRRVDERLDGQHRELQPAGGLHGRQRCEDELRTRLRGDLEDELIGAAHIDRDGDAFRPQQPEEGQRPLRPIDRPDQHPVARLDALLAQDARDPRHLGADVGVAPGVRAEAGLDEERRPRDRAEPPPSR